MTARPRFSVVVASFRDLGSLAQCLDTLVPQCNACGAELLVARGPHEPPDALRRVAAGCRVVGAPIEADIPRLRGIGLAAANGDWVALAEDNCVADASWLPALIDASGPGAEVLGGSMGNAQRARATDCGAFFSEYGYFGANRSEAPGAGPPLVTGANVAYARSIVADVADWATRGEWENVIHDRLHAAGHRFRLVPRARLRQNLHYGVAAFCRDRFEHGRNYSATRARGRPLWHRVMLAAPTPILPVLRAARLALAADPEERPHFGRALPATITFLTAWSVGEAVGYFRAGASR